MDIKAILSFFKRKVISNTVILLLAFAVNFAIFYSFPVIYYLKGPSKPETKTAARKQLKLSQYRSEPKKEKKRKLKIKKVQPQKTTSKTRQSRFKMKLGAGGTGVGMATADMKKIVFKANEVDKEARPVSQSAPDYPQDALDAGIAGEVFLIIVIDETGSVTSARVLKENPQGLGFGEAAVSAAYNWRFRPAEKENIPVRMEYEVPVLFGK